MKSFVTASLLALAFLCAGCAEENPSEPIADNPLVAPSNPVPADGATRVSNDADLSWYIPASFAGTVTYDVYFGNTNPPTQQYSSNQATASESVASLLDSATYYWRVVVRRSANDTVAGPVWRFTTRPAGILLNDMVTVTGGSFPMGSNANVYEQPIHTVTLSSYQLERYEVTYDRWTSVRTWGLAHGYSDLPAGTSGYGGTATHPVTNVNWYDVIKWCNARSEMEGLAPVYHTNAERSIVYRSGNVDIPHEGVKGNANGYRLATEAEWEFAARGGNSTHSYQYAGSDSLSRIAWYTSNSQNVTHAVGSLAPNELGLYDMSGNAWEWCWDWYGAYGSASLSNPLGTSSGTSRILRGGSFIDAATDCRVSVRSVHVPTARYFTRGVRCAMNQ